MTDNNKIKEEIKYLECQHKQTIEIIDSYWSEIAPIQKKIDDLYEIVEEDDDPEVWDEIGYLENSIRTAQGNLALNEMNLGQIEREIGEAKSELRSE